MFSFIFYNSNDISQFKDFQTDKMFLMMSDQYLSADITSTNGIC